MLETLTSLSSRLRWFKPFVIFIGLVCLSIFGSSIFDTGYFKEEVYLIPSVADFFWSLLLFTLLHTFTNIPIKSDKKATFFKRIKYWFLRLGYRILAIVFLLMTVAGLIFSFRLIRVWFAN